MDRRKFTTIFACILVGILVLVGYDIIERKKVEQYGIAEYDEETYYVDEIGYKQNEMMYIKLEPGVNECTLDRQLYEYAHTYASVGKASLSLKSIERLEDNYRVCFQCVGYSTYYVAMIYSLDNFERTEVETNAGKFNLEFACKETVDKNVVNYYYDIVHQNQAKFNDMDKVTDIKFPLDNVVCLSYQRKPFGFSFQITPLAICIVIGLWAASYLTVFRKCVWMSYYNEEELRMYPDKVEKGHYIYLYTHLGAVIRSLGFGGIVMMILFLTKELWVQLVGSLTLGSIWLFTGGNEKALIGILGVVATLLYLKSIRNNVIREIKVEE